MSPKTRSDAPTRSRYGVTPPIWNGVRGVTGRVAWGKNSELDIVVAIEGRAAAFACEHLLAEGPGGDTSVDYAVSCILSQAMSRADLTWRRELASRTLADIRREVEAKHPETPGATRAWFVSAQADGRRLARR